MVAIVGGTGFLGKHVAAALHDAGIEVRILSRRTGFDGLRPNAESLKGADAVVNLAGIKREEGRQTFQAVHVELVDSLIRPLLAKTRRNSPMSLRLFSAGVLLAPG